MITAPSPPPAKVMCRTGGESADLMHRRCTQTRRGQGLNILDNARLFAMALTGRLALHERQTLSWASHCADSNAGLSKVVHDSLCSDRNMRHRRPRNFRDGRHDIGAATSPTERPFSSSGVHSECIRGNLLVSVRQPGAPRIFVLDPTVAHDRVLPPISGRLGSSPSNRWGVGGAGSVASPHGGGPNVYR